MYDVLVLMSTYNGKDYIEQQIESILYQKGVNINLLIRDDGSTDGTLEILKSLSESNNNIEIIEGKNYGWRKSFSELIIAADNKYDYYGFSDQDDYWFENKIINAIKKIEDYNQIPCLYRGRSYIADEDLRNSNIKFQDIPVPSTIESLFQNFCQGCTLVFNKKLKEMYSIYPLDMISHDIWLPLIAIHTGKIVDDNEAYMLYRVHNNNATAGMNKLQILKQRILRVFSKELNNYNINFGRILYIKYKQYLNEDSINICYKMANFFNSFSCKKELLLSKEIKGKTIWRTIIVKFFILTNRFRSNI